MPAKNAFPVNPMSSEMVIYYNDTMPCWGLQSTHPFCVPLSGTQGQRTVYIYLFCFSVQLLSILYPAFATAPFALLSLQIQTHAYSLLEHKQLHFLKIQKKHFDKFNAFLVLICLFKTFITRLSNKTMFTTAAHSHKQNKIQIKTI